MLPHPGEKHQVVATIQPPQQPASGPNHQALVKRTWAGYGRKTDAGNPSLITPCFADYPQPAKVNNPKELKSFSARGLPAFMQVTTNKYLYTGFPHVVDTPVDE